MGSEDEDDTLAKLVPPPKPKGFLETVQEGAFAALDRMTKKKACTCPAECATHPFVATPKAHPLHHEPNICPPERGCGACPSPVAKKPLSPHLEKNKYHDALLDAVADLAVEVGAPMDIVVELHPDHKVRGYVVRLARGVGEMQVVTFHLGVEDVVQIDPAKLEFLVLGALRGLTGKEYVKQPKPQVNQNAGKWDFLTPSGITVTAVGPRGKPPSGGSNVSHAVACVCAKCQQKAIQAGPVDADATHPDVPLARRPIDPTKVLDLGDRVMDLE